LKVAYFINQYPKVSHSFIRREIMAVERQGIEVQRIALRGWDDPLPDEDDRRERERTRYVLRQGIFGLILPTIRALLRSPARFLSATALAVRMARNSERALPYHLICVAEACRILPWLSAFEALRIHAHFGTNSTEVVMLARVLGGPPYSFTAHGFDDFMLPIGLAEKVHRSAFVVAVSSSGRSQLYLKCQYADWYKVHVVHCGLEKSFYEIPPVPLPSVPRLICVGRLSAEKGQLLLVAALARLAAVGREFELVLAGDGPMRANIEALVAKHDLRSRVRITGWISSAAVRDEILAARALVLPSFAEGLPVVLMEAMALRRPVVATYVAGIPELVRPGENGWLVPAGSVDDLVAALDDCLSQPLAQLERFGAAAFERVTARHSIDTEAGKLAALFRDDPSR
jgi:colanic acid/amylovoran biosynthesis glycosyltransferase